MSPTLHTVTEYHLISDILLYEYHDGNSITQLRAECMQGNAHTPDIIWFKHIYPQKRLGVA